MYIGTSIFEPVALALASSNLSSGKSQQTSRKQILSEAHKVIYNITDKLITSESYSNKPNEVSDIRAVCQNGENEVSEIHKG